MAHGCAVRRGAYPELVSDGRGTGGRMVRHASLPAAPQPVLPRNRPRHHRIPALRIRARFHQPPPEYRPRTTPPSGRPPRYTIDPMTHRIAAVLLGVAFACLHPLAAQPGGGRGGAGAAAAGPPPTVESRTTGMRKIDGYFPLYWDERTGSLFLEIPRFDTEFLFTGGLAAGLGSNDIGLDRGAEGAGHVVSF